MASAERERERPDVVVALTTQWRARALGIAGDPNARTPRLDEAARGGVWLAQAVTPHPFGVFARAAFLTGRRCPANGIRGYFDPLPEGARALALAFGESGYETAFFGKWQLYERDPAAPVVGEAHARIVVPPERRGGFDFWEGFESGFLLNDPLLHGTELPEPTRFAGYQSDVLVERLLRFRERRAAGSKPLFAVLSLDAPHPPYAAPAGGVEPYPENGLRLIDGTAAEPEARAKALRELSGYYAHIEATDRALGRLLDALEGAGARRRTLFAFSSVHGDMHGVDGKFRKGWPHEESVRVPMLIRWPGRLEPRRDDALLMSLLDLGPTMLGLATGADAAGLARHGFHGRDLSEAVRGRARGPAQQEISMPSAPPFALQCPYAWAAHRDAEKTAVYPENGDPFTLWHRGEKGFEEARGKGRGLGG